MRKPTAFHFWMLYAASLVFAWIAVAWWLHRKGANVSTILLAISGINICAAIFNLIGTAFAANGVVPWRDEESKHQ